jgi:hypothetical protein
MRPARSPPGTLADRSAREKRSKHPGYLQFTEAAPETTAKGIGCFGRTALRKTYGSYACGTTANGIGCGFRALVLRRGFVGFGW